MEARKHPFQIACGPNPQMDCFDVSLQFGNFSGHREAKQFADDLAKIIVEHMPSAWALERQ